MNVLKKFALSQLNVAKKIVESRLKDYSYRFWGMKRCMFQRDARFIRNRFEQGPSVQDKHGIMSFRGTHIAVISYFDKNHFKIIYN